MARQPHSHSRLPALYFLPTLSVHLNYERTGDSIAIIPFPFTSGAIYDSAASQSILDTWKQNIVKVQLEEENLDHE